jgi:hypothetical protein
MQRFPLAGLYYTIVVDMLLVRNLIHHHNNIGNDMAHTFGGGTEEIGTWKDCVNLCMFEHFEFQCCL